MNSELFDAVYAIIQKKEIVFNEVILMNGSKCGIIMPHAFHISRAQYEFSAQRDFDATIFYMRELCKIDGKKQDLVYYLELSIDDYISISEVMSASLERIFKK